MSLEARGDACRQGAKLVGHRVRELARTDVSGRQGVDGDLGSLRNQVEKDEPDAARVAKLFGDLSDATIRIAGWRASRGTGGRRSARR